MSWILDIAIVGIIGIVAYYILTSMGSGGLGLAPVSGAAPPAEGGKTTAEEKYGLAPSEECKKRGSDTEGVKCKCQEDGIITFGLCDMPEGIKCSVNIASTKATEDNIKDIGLEDCKMNASREEIEMALGGTPAAESKYARSYYSVLPPFTMRRSDGLNIAEPRGFMGPARRPRGLWG